MDGNKWEINDLRRNVWWNTNDLRESPQFPWSDWGRETAFVRQILPGPRRMTFIFHIMGLVGLGWTRLDWVGLGLTGRKRTLGHSPSSLPLRFGPDAKIART
jgi:hypothetical protein